MGKRQAELIVDSVRSREPSPFGIALRRFDLGRSQRPRFDKLWVTQGFEKCFSILSCDGLGLPLQLMRT